MRDPNRIDPLLKELGDFWKKNPDLRLGQIICNLPCLAKRMGLFKGGNDVFYVEDDVIKKVLEKKNE